MHILLTLCLLAAADVVTPVVTDDVSIVKVTRLLPRAQPDELRRGDLLILDLDNTVFREVQWLGTDDWYMRAHAALTALGHDALAVSRHMEPLNVKIKNASQMRLMEEGMPAWIARLQNQGVIVMGLTARHPTLAEPTLRALRGLGIEFGHSLVPGDFTAFTVPGFEDRHFSYEGGVAFTDGVHKGRVMGAMLDRGPFRPGRTMAIDDRIHHVNSFVESLLDRGIPGQVIHYLKAEEEDYDEAAAAHQQRYFEMTGHLLTNEEAVRQCALFL